MIGMKSFPKIKKSISDFLCDDEGTTLRTKAAIFGPTAIAAAVLMSKELVTASAAGYVSHRSHASHSSASRTGPEDKNIFHATHSSHSSRSSSGFSHSADTYAMESRTQE